jgi:hypothetical protein
MRNYLLIIVLLAASAIPGPAYAQEPAFPLPADLYILTSDQMIVRVDAVDGGQTIISPPEQPVTDFAIAPDGAWYVYRTSANNAVIVTELDGISGYVLEFDVTMPPDLSGRTIAWSPDTAAIAYLVLDGVRIAELGAGQYGEALFSTIQGGPWTELHWISPDILIVTDSSGRSTQISGHTDSWTVETIETSPGAIPETAIPASMSASGVVLADGTVVPGTAGALAFDWGPSTTHRAGPLQLPDNLYFLMADYSGRSQVWLQSLSGDSRRAVTAESDPVISYDVAPDLTRIAYATDTRLFAANLDGSNRIELAQLSTELSHPFMDWSPNGSQIAYSDQRGVWLVPADASQPPRLLAQTQRGQGQQMNVNEIRVYFKPRWNPDGTRLLIGIGFFEGSVLGVVDVASGQVTELGQIIASQGRWTNDGRVLTWSASWGYETPGLYILDPANPGVQPETVLGSQFPVMDAVQTQTGDWIALAGSSGQMGPQFLHALAAPSLSGPFEAVSDKGGFAQHPELRVSGQTIMVAGLTSMVYDDLSGVWAGKLVVIDLNSGETFPVETSGLISQIQWGGSN